VVCNGWTLPTQIKEPPNVKVLIEWKTFVIVASDSEEAKGNLMKDAMALLRTIAMLQSLGFKSRKITLVRRQRTK
jgi:hypothetical protein